MIKHATYAVAREDLREAILEYNPSTEGYIATEVLPLREVQKKAATLSVITRENLKRSDVKHANGAAFNRVNLTSEDLAYACKDRGLEAVLTDEDRENYATDYDAELETTQMLQHNLLIEQEIRVKDLIFNTTTFTGSDLYNDVSAAPWDAAASDAIGHVQAAKEKVRTNSGTEANSLVIGAATLSNLLGNTAIKARFPGAAVITEQMILDNVAAIFGLENLLVGKKVYDSANEGQSYSGADIWPDDYAMVCRVNRGSLRTAGIGRTVIWTPMSPTNVTVAQYREEQTEGDVYRVRQYTDEKIFDANFGHLLKVDA